MQDPLTIFEYIKIINSLTAKELSLAKQKILIDIAIHLGENDNIWHKNIAIAEHTGLEKDSIKVLLSALKKSKYIETGKAGSKRLIFLCHPVIKKRLMVINQNGKRLMVINQKVNGGLPPLLKEQGKEQNNNVVVSLLKKYGLNLDQKNIVWLSSLDHKKRLSVLEYTRAESPRNPNGFLLSMQKGGWIIPEFVNQDGKDRQRILDEIELTRKAQALGFGYNNKIEGV